MEEVDSPKAHVIGVEFYSKRTSKSFNLVNNANPNLFVDAKRTWYNYDFARPVYIFEVSVFASGYESYNEIDFEVDHIDGTRHTQSLKVGNGNATLAIGKLASAFRFRPHEKVFSSPQIQKVQVIGFTLDEFNSFEWFIKEYDKKKEEIESREATILEIDALDKEKAETRRLLDSSIGTSKAELEKIRSQQTEAQATLTSVREVKAKLDDDLLELETRRSGLRKNVTELESQLQMLTSDLRLFPSEISGFVKEGNRSIIWYICMSIPFVVVIYVVLEAVFSGAVDLSQIWKEPDGIDIWTIILSRLPFVLVAFALLEVCGFIVGRLFAEIMKINRQRITLSKLSIIARDVTTAASHGSSMTKDEVYEQEVKLKMELLRAHMAEDVGADFQYKGTFLQTLANGAVELLKPKEK